MKLDVFGETAGLKKNEIFVEAHAPMKKPVVSRLNVHNGHKLFEINLMEGTLDEVIYESKHVFFLTKFKEYTYVEKPHCIYLPALNEKNAMRKLIKIQAKRGIVTEEIK